MTLNNVAIGKRIQTVRKKRGLSQFTLAGIVDRSPGYISYIETGFKSMSLETFVALANALQVSSDELLVDCLENTVKASNHSFASILADCSEYERRVLEDIVVASKASLRANRGYVRTRR